jgi:hypothetical protein
MAGLGSLPFQASRLSTDMELTISELLKISRVPVWTESPQCASENSCRSRTIGSNNDGDAFVDRRESRIEGNKRGIIPVLDASVEDANQRIEGESKTIWIFFHQIRIRAI